MQSTPQRQPKYQQKTVLQGRLADHEPDWHRQADEADEQEAQVHQALELQHNLISEAWFPDGRSFMLGRVSKLGREEHEPQRDKRRAHLDEAFGRHPDRAPGSAFRPQPSLDGPRQQDDIGDPTVQQCQ